MTIVHCDNLDQERGLPSLAENSVDAIVTDPPAGIGFMGKSWDSARGGRVKWVEWLRLRMAECLRVLKPGGHAFVWALPKRSHWTATAVEDAGFEIRDVHHHIFGTGMPKSKAELKPAVEYWILARKPFRGTLTRNIATWGVGALNIEDCRVEGRPDAPGTTPPTANGNGRTHGAMTRKSYVVPDGRWPAHLSLDEAGAAQLDKQSGHLRGGNRPRVRRGFGSTSVGGDFAGEKMDADGASRFFYVAKASRAERTLGGTVDNDHETVKSIALMRWLCRLITPSGGLVVDPFAGSGTTGVACALEGFRFLGFEESAKHAVTASKRIEMAVMP